MNLHTIKQVTAFYAYLLVVWGFYRLLFQIPEPFDELLVKPLIWLVPLYVLLKKEGRGWDSVGISTKNILPAVYLSLLLGIIFTIEAVFINILKYRGLNFSSNIRLSMFIGAVVISFVTALSEELVFRGYIFNRLWETTGNALKSNLVISIGWSLLHLPIALFDWRLQVSSLVIYIVLTFIFSFGASFLFARTKNIAAPIILHVLWAWPVILFR